MSKQRQKIKITKLSKDYNFPPEVFIPIKSGKFIDNVVSKKGGTMPATITVVVGEPGSGKTTMLVDKMANIDSYNEDKECLYISSEMSPIDNMELAEELPQLMNLNTLYLSEYENPKEAIEDALTIGWDYVIMDSFADIQAKIKDCDTIKMTGTAVETWLIKLLTDTSMGNNERNKYTAFDVIQHITKGGTYSGSTKLKHNTTAMLYVRVDKKTDERFLIYDKNRRGNINRKVYMELTNGELVYDEKRYNELEEAIKTKKNIENYEKSSENELFDLLGDIENEFTVEEEIS